MSFSFCAELRGTMEDEMETTNAGGLHKSAKAFTRQDINALFHADSCLDAFQTAARAAWSSRLR
eukprot:6191520-Pleurochrysis_carterae.AAC.1